MKSWWKRLKKKQQQQRREKKKKNRRPKRSWEKKSKNKAHAQRTRSNAGTVQWIVLLVQYNKKEATKTSNTSTGDDVQLTEIATYTQKCRTEEEKTNSKTDWQQIKWKTNEKKQQLRNDTKEKNIHRKTHRT